MKYIVDIDNTICVSIDSDYNSCIPIEHRIEKINNLYDQGHTVVYWTARGQNSGKDWTLLTHKQLNDWNCKYHELWMNKPSYDVWIDDKADWIF
jgi:hypothetical protein